MGGRTGGTAEVNTPCKEWIPVSLPIPILTSIPSSSSGCSGRNIPTDNNKNIRKRFSDAEQRLKGVEGVGGCPFGC